MTEQRRLFAGSRVRDLRSKQGLSQTAMARAIGISIPYLSQIENDDRPLTSAVLMRLSQAFPAEWASVEEGGDAAFMVDAFSAASDPSIPDDRLEVGEVERALRQQPALARRMAALHRAYRRSQEQLRILDDKVEAGVLEGPPLPWEQVRDWFHAESNYVDTLDRRAEEIADAFNGEMSATILERLLMDRFGIHVGTLSDHEAGTGSDRGSSTVMRRFDPVNRVLHLNRSLPTETALFALAHQFGRIEFADSIADIAAASNLSTPAARQLLAAGLTNYAAGALLMPYGPFRQAALDHRHDIDRLRQIFGTSFEQTCHRLSNLQRPGAAGVPFFFCRIDLAGNITKRHSATRMQFARFGGACPMWVVHEAVAIPDRILVQLAETPDGVRYVSMAKGLVKHSGSYDRPPRRYAVALGCEESHAPAFVYADSVRTGGMATPIGTSCRICPRTDCDQRAFPPAASEIGIDANSRAAVPYTFS